MLTPAPAFAEFLIKPWQRRCPVQRLFPGVDRDM